jgi:periplasmic copper chaperone A
MIVTMARGLLLVLVFFLLFAAAGAAQKDLSASKGWVKAPAAGEKTTTAFVVVENPTMYDVYVVSVETDVAGSVTFQRAAASPDGEAESVEHVTAPAYDSVELTPDGVHMRLDDLNKPLKPGDIVTLVLTTDSGVAIEASAEVRQN